MHFRFSRWPTVPVSMSVTAVLAATILVSSGRSQNPSAQHTVEFFNNWDKGREQFQRASDVLKAMEVSTGDWVADVGAGGGYYSQRLARLVGPSGRVFAEDIVAMSLLDERMKLFDLRNVEAVKGEVDDPKLPADSLAAVLVVDAYHHFSQYQSMTEHILRTLKPGGRLVIADYSLSRDRSQPRADQIKRHEIDPALVQTDLEQTGFQVLRCEDPFLKRVPEAKGTRAAEADLWLLTAVRPKP